LGFDDLAEQARPATAARQRDASLSSRITRHPHNRPADERTAMTTAKDVDGTPLPTKSAIAASLKK
jgi:hypothetical protein